MVDYLTGHNQSFSNMPSAPNQRSSPCAVWDLTLSRSPEAAGASSPADIRSELCAIAKKWVFQGERGDATEAHPEGYLHWQIRISLIKKRRERELAALLKRLGGYLRFAHVSCTSTDVARDMLEDAEAFYVMKADTRVEGEGPFADNDEPEQPVTEVLRFMQEHGLRPWQQKIADSRKESTQNDRFRVINVIVDKTGGAGKSMLTEYLEYHKIAEAVPSMFTEAQDYMQWVMGRPKYGMYIFDMPRALPKKNLNQLYAAIESIKDGVCFDKRYSAKKERMERPIIWVFTNEVPPFAALSMDRWRMWQIAGQELRTINPRDMQREPPRAPGAFGAAAALGDALRDLLGLAGTRTESVPDDVPMAQVVNMDEVVHYE